MHKRQTILIVIVLALACVITAGYKFAAKWHASEGTTLPPSSCDPSVQECWISLPQGGRLRLSIEPRPIRPLQKLSLGVSMEGQSASTVAIDFDGVDMSMGYNRPVLSGSDGHFSGETILPVCITGKMKWKATVLISTEREQIAAPFHFEIAGQ